MPAPPKTPVRQFCTIITTTKKYFASNKHPATGTGATNTLLPVLVLGRTAPSSDPFVDPFFNKTPSSTHSSTRPLHRPTPSSTRPLCRPNPFIDPFINQRTPPLSIRPFRRTDPFVDPTPSSTWLTPLSTRPLCQPSVVVSYSITIKQ